MEKVREEGCYECIGTHTLKRNERVRCSWCEYEGSNKCSEFKNRAAKCATCGHIYNICTVPV